MEIFKLLGTIAINNSEANSQIDETMGHAETGQERMTAAFAKIGMVVAGAFTTTKMVEFGKACINAASDVEEMQNKFNVVFGDLSDTVDAWANDYADAIGRNSNTIKTYLADNQNMLVGMGATREEGASLSEQLVSLALDLASFNNLSEPDAVNALSKAMMGETESAKTLGAVLNDNTRAQAMLDLGYQGTYDSLTEVQKMEVNYRAILNQSQDAIGDCERSMGSYKSTTIELTSAKEKLQETIGNMLLPAITKLAQAATDGIRLIQSMVEWMDKHKTTVEVLSIGFGTLTAAVIANNAAQALRKIGIAAAMTAEGAQAVMMGTSTIALGAQTVATGLATAATTAFGAAVAFLTSPITIAIAAIGLIIAGGVALYKNWDWLSEKAGQLGSWISEKWEGIKQATVEKFNAVKDTMTGAMSTAKQEISSRLGEIKRAYDENGGGIKGIAAATMEGVRQYYKAGYDVLNALTGGKLGEITAKFKNGMGTIFSTVSNAFNNVKETISNAINGAANIVGNAIDRIKGFFNFSWSLPHLSMPHPYVSGSFSLKPPSVPHFGIDWYAKGGILTEPTVFGMNPKTGNAQVGGEAGAEAVAPIETLLGYIRTAVAEQNTGLAQKLDRLMELLTQFFPDILTAMNRALVLDTGELVGGIAPAMDEELGKLYDRKGRGV